MLDLVKTHKTVPCTAITSLDGTTTRCGKTAHYRLTVHHSRRFEGKDKPSIVWLCAEHRDKLKDMTLVS